MKQWKSILAAALLCLSILSCNPASSAASPIDQVPVQTEIPNLGAAGDNPNPPANPVKLIFIHHSSGGDWLADPASNGLGGDLGRALMNNNYYVSATNYGWGPDGIGDRTDIGHWWDWFRGPQSAVYTAALYTESGQNVGSFGSWPRLPTDPGGENQIILFKACFPNSNLSGNPTDPATTGDNPMRGAAAGDASYTVANAKGIYNDLLVYFSAHPEKLFIVITAPPLVQSATNAALAANARAFNNWLVADWLTGYPLKNVAVFDFYTVLTSNGGSANTSDAGSETGNHHRWWNGAVQHLQTVNNNYAAYPLSASDSHPNYAGNQKATAEFVQLLNVYYHRWADAAPQVRLFLPAIRKGG